MLGFIVSYVDLPGYCLIMLGACYHMLLCLGYPRRICVALDWMLGSCYSTLICLDIVLQLETLAIGLPNISSGSLRTNSNGKQYGKQNSGNQ